MSVQLYDTVLKNTTSSGISISDLSGLYIPASGTVDITDLFPFQRLIYSLDLENVLVSSGVVLNIEGYDLSAERAQIFLSHHDATYIQGIPVGGSCVGIDAANIPGNLIVKYNRAENQINLEEVDFLGLSDTPASYSGRNNYLVHVNSTATGLDFSDMGEHNLLFGNQFIYAEDTAESSTNSTTYIEKLTLSRTVSSGTYRVGWYFEWDVSSETIIFYARIQLNGADIGTVADTAASAHTAWGMTSGFYYTTLSSGTLQLDLDYRCAVSNKTAYIRNARLEFWRTE